MSKERDESGKFTESVGPDDVLAAFDAVDGPVVTTSDVAAVCECSESTARRKLERLHREGRIERRTTAGRVVYWRTDPPPNPVDPEDPIFTDRPTFASGAGDLSERVDEMLYGNGP